MRWDDVECEKGRPRATPEIPRAEVARVARLEQ